MTLDLAFKERRLAAIEALRLAAEADDDDDYAEAYDALIALEREAGEFDDYEPGVCRVCGCTDLEACEGGCEWVDAEHTLCSNCGHLIDPSAVRPCVDGGDGRAGVDPAVPEPADGPAETDAGELDQ